MRITTRLAALALSATAAVIAPAAAGVGAAQAAVTAVSPDILQSSCKNSVGNVNVYMNNEIGCVSFRGVGVADELDLPNTYKITTGKWSGSFVGLSGVNLIHEIFKPGQTYALPDDTIIISVEIDE